LEESKRKIVFVKQIQSRGQYCWTIDSVDNKRFKDIKDPCFTFYIRYRDQCCGMNALFFKIVLGQELSKRVTTTRLVDSVWNELDAHAKDISNQAQQAYCAAKMLS
jgi:hypothetical protein